MNDWIFWALDLLAAWLIVATVVSLVIVRVLFEPL